MHTSCLPAMSTLLGSPFRIDPHSTGHVCGSNSRDSSTNGTDELAGRGACWPCHRCIACIWGCSRREDKPTQVTDLSSHITLPTCELALCYIYIQNIPATRDHLWTCCQACRPRLATAPGDDGSDPNLTSTCFLRTQDCSCIVREQLIHPAHDTKLKSFPAPPTPMKATLEAVSYCNTQQRYPHHLSTRLHYSRLVVDIALVHSALHEYRFHMDCPMPCRPLLSLNYCPRPASSPSLDSRPQASNLLMISLLDYEMR